MAKKLFKPNLIEISAKSWVLDFFMILDFTSITKCYCMLSYCSKNHLKSHKWQKNSSTPNFIEIGANLWILELFMNSDFTGVSICYHIFPKIIQKVTYGKKNSSTQNFMRIKARSWILDFFMVFGFHSNNKVSLYDLLLV